jgi:hypothetical protein
MDVEAPGGLLRAFAGLKDPRMERTKQHSLADILAIAVCAVICGAEGWTQVELFGNSKLKWFKTFLNLPNGVPSHDTFDQQFGVPAEACVQVVCHILLGLQAGQAPLGGPGLFGRERISIHQTAPFVHR